MQGTKKAQKEDDIFKFGLQVSKCFICLLLLFISKCNYKHSDPYDNNVQVIKLLYQDTVGFL